MKVSLLVSVARQVEGEYVFVNVVKANTDPNKLRQFLSENTLRRTDVIQGIDCVIEYGVVTDVEVEGI